MDKKSKKSWNFFIKIINLAECINWKAEIRIRGIFLICVKKKNVKHPLDNLTCGTIRRFNIST